MKVKQKKEDRDKDGNATSTSMQSLKECPSDFVVGIFPEPGPSRLLDTFGQKANVKY